MEMPEGWKVCFECDTSTDGGKERVHKALNLMKEMAEALEQYEGHMNEDHTGAFTYEDEVLKKFKEWK